MLSLIFFFFFKKNHWKKINPHHLLPQQSSIFWPHNPKMSRKLQQWRLQKTRREGPKGVKQPSALTVDRCKWIFLYCIWHVRLQASALNVILINAISASRSKTKRVESDSEEEKAEKKKRRRIKKPEPDSSDEDGEFLCFPHWIFFLKNQQMKKNDNLLIHFFSHSRFSAKAGNQTTVTESREGNSTCFLFTGWCFDSSGPLTLI